MVDRASVGLGQQPRAHRPALGFEPLGRGPHAREHGLAHVLGGLAVAGETPGECEHSTGVPAVHLAERPGITLHDPSHQGRVASLAKLIRHAGSPNGSPYSVTHRGTDITEHVVLDRPPGDAAAPRTFYDPGPRWGDGVAAAGPRWLVGGQPAMNASSPSRATSSCTWLGGDFMRYWQAGSTGPPMPRSRASLAQRTASMMTPAELGESCTSSLSSTVRGTSPKLRPSSRMKAHLRSSSHGT